MEKKLAEIKVSMKKIFTNIAIRMIWFVIAMLAGIFNTSKDNTPNVLWLLLIVGTILYALFPLIHIKDVLVYYENKIVLKNKQITFNDPSEIQWHRTTYFIRKKLTIRNSAAEESFIECMLSTKEIDVTYMKDAKDLFIKCYLNEQ